MRKRGQLAPHLLQTRGIHVADDNAGSGLQLGDNQAPWIDENAVAEGTATVGMHSALRRGKDIALVLDGTRAKQHMPMRRPGYHRECRRHEDQRKVGELPIELRKSHVVTNRKRHPAARRLERNRCLTRLDGLSLVVSLVTLVEGEQMHLVVNPDPPAAR